MEGGPQVNLARQLRFDVSPRLDRGTLVHAWFQQIEWLDDGRPTEDVLRHIAAAPELRGLDVDELLREFYAALEKPAIHKVLCGSTYQQPLGAAAPCAIHATGSGKRWRWHVWRERPFAVRDANAILNGKIDRLVVLFDGDQIVAADVLDYKTDRLPANDPRAIDARAEIYRPQLEAYRRAVSKLFRLSLERISARLLFVEIGVARTI
jgi:ATP-dependent exoDNAse (exonuclease V) beta subunit